jgi:hypothetical protein
MKIAVYTSIFGGRDTLHENQFKMEGVDYLCFTDESFKSDTWNVIKSIPIYSDPNRNAKKYKILPHRYLKEYDYSVWIDGNFLITSDIRDIVERGEYLAYDHNQSNLDPRDCVYKEYNAIIQLGKQNKGNFKDNPNVMYNQINRYLKEGYPQNNGLTTNGIMFRNHNNPDIIKLMEEWWLEIKHNSKRDQLSFDYIAWKNNFKIKYIPGDNRQNSYFTLNRHKKKK